MSDKNNLQAKEELQKQQRTSPNKKKQSKILIT